MKFGLMRRGGVVSGCVATRSMARWSCLGTAGSMILFGVGGLAGEAQELTLTRSEATVRVEPFAPNVVRVSVSLRKQDALRAAGYGISARPAGAG